MGQFFNNQHIIVVNFNFFATVWQVNHSMSGVHFAYDDGHVVRSATDVQLFAVTLLSALNGSIGQLAVGGGHPFELGPVRVGQHLVIPLFVLFAMVRNVGRCSMIELSVVCGSTRKISMLNKHNTFKVRHIPCQECSRHPCRHAPHIEALRSGQCRPSRRPPESGHRLWFARQRVTCIRYLRE